MQQNSPTQDPLERRLLDEIGRIEKKIAELNNERKAIERLLIRYRQEQFSAKDITRKNSVNRLMIENSIIDSLNRSGGKPVTSKHLYSAALEIDIHLNESTFRSHLHRMKKRGLIDNPGNQDGKWVISNK